MKYLKVFLFLFSLLSAGCTQAVRTQGVDSIGVDPKQTFVAYFFSAGPSERYRAAFLKGPESGVEVVASRQVTETRATFEDAMTFVQRPTGYRQVHVRSVIYRDKTIGYLLIQFTSALGRQPLEVNVYERNGKIYFSAWEIPYD